MTTDLIIRLCAIPLISAATGYVTNYIAVRMLFRPRREIRVLGIRFQGLIPRRRRQIAVSIADTIEKHLFSHEDIKKVLLSPEVEHRIRDLFDQRFDAFVETGLKHLHPMVGLLLTKSMIEKLRLMLLHQLNSAIPAAADKLIDLFEQKIDFKQLIVEKIEGFDLDLFEQIVLRIASRELRAIEVWGGALGLFIGLLTDLLLLF